MVFGALVIWVFASAFAFVAKGRAWKQCGLSTEAQRLTSLPCGLTERQFQALHSLQYHAHTLHRVAEDDLTEGFSLIARVAAFVYELHLLENCGFARLSGTEKEHLDLISQTELVPLELVLDLLISLLALLWWSVSATTYLRGTGCGIRNAPALSPWPLKTGRNPCLQSTTELFACWLKGCSCEPSRSSEHKMKRYRRLERSRCCREYRSMPCTNV